MDKQKLYRYKDVDEAIEQLSSFEKDWTYSALDYCALHKTGLEMRMEFKDDNVSVSCPNMKEWLKHMCVDEGLTRLETERYLYRLIQEFQALSDKNGPQVDVTKIMMPYMFVQSMKNRYRS